MVSVDGYQSQESEIVYVLTTRSLGDEEPSDDQRILTFDPLQFVKDKRRATVALSRAKAGLFVHGNLRTMAMGEAWRKFSAPRWRKPTLWTHASTPRIAINRAIDSQI